MDPGVSVTIRAVCGRTSDELDIPGSGLERFGSEARVGHSDTREGDHVNGVGALDHPGRRQHAGSTMERVTLAGEHDSWRISRPGEEPDFGGEGVHRLTI